MLGLAPKDAIALGQTVGYMLGKWAASTVVPRLGRQHRLPLLLALSAVTVAPLALFGRAGDEPGWQVLWMSANGWPLGWFYGTFYLYLEGRSAPEVLGSCISAAFIVGSGAAKSAGATLLGLGVAERWMPLAAGCFYGPALVLAILGLDCCPAPSAAEVAARGQRGRLGLAEQRAFLRAHGAAVGLTVLAYTVLRALQDFRADFQTGAVASLGLSILSPPQPSPSSPPRPTITPAQLPPRPPRPKAKR